MATSISKRITLVIVSLMVMFQLMCLDVFAFVPAESEFTTFNEVNSSIATIGKRFQYSENQSSDVLSDSWTVNNGTASKPYYMTFNYYGKVQEFYISEKSTVELHVLITDWAGNPYSQTVNCGILTMPYFSQYQSEMDEVTIADAVITGSNIRGKEAIVSATLDPGIYYFAIYSYNSPNGRCTYSGRAYATYKATKGWSKDAIGWYWIDDNGKKVKNKWIKDAGNWYYISPNGYMVTNEWIKDSKGWCYLGSDGKMVANGWAKDSKGWVWMNGSGYWDTRTRWIKYDGGWYHTTKGYRDQNKWKKDSKGWCYLGNNGRMVTNGWAKDSHGWCWMGSNGYWVKSKWVKDKGEWYYIKSNHYMASNEWAKDSGGWMFMAKNGKITKSKWIKSGGAWYYLKDNGYMATGTLKIGSKTYKFASSGKWVK